MPRLLPWYGAVASAALALGFAAAGAADTLKVSAAGRDAFQNQVSEVGQTQGLFKKQGLELEMSYAEDAGAALASVIAGTADVGVSVGTLATLAASGKGAPVRILGSAVIGSPEFWYVRADSRIKGLKDAAGKSVAYGASGSASHLTLLGLQELYSAKLKPVATGGPAATLIQVMSGQVDIGYSIPPVAVAEFAAGKIRIIAHGNDLPALAGQTTRFIIANADTLAKRPDAVRRYMQGYRETVDWLFSADPQAIAAYANWAGVPEAVARRTRDEFMARDSVLPDRIAGLDAIVADAVTFGFLPAPLAPDQLKTLTQPQDPIR
jgi:NitT/TauT family transport system substrate-binding protein